MYVLNESLKVYLFHVCYEISSLFYHGSTMVVCLQISRDVKTEVKIKYIVPVNVLIKCTIVKIEFH